MNNPLYETIKARALEALHATITPSALVELRQRAGGWVLKNRVAVAVLKATSNRSRVGKVESAKVQRDILKAMLGDRSSPDAAPPTERVNV